MVTSCEAVTDGSFFRRSGCFYDLEKCPLKDKKDQYDNDVRFFAEQRLDAGTSLLDEIFDFSNDITGKSGGGPTAPTPPYSQMVLDGHYEGDWITESPSAGKSDRAENCSDNGGKLAGIGPSCEIDERGRGELHQCVFDAVKECEAERQNCLSALSYESFEGYGDRFDIAITPVKKPDTCDEAFKDCKESETKECICSDCIYGKVCITDCEEDDPGDGDGDGDGDEEFIKEGLALATQRFTASSYDIPIPIIYGNYISMGNIIWASEARVTLIEETDTVVDEDRVRTYITRTRVTHGDFALALSEGPIDGLMRVWFGDTLLFSHAINVDENGAVQDTGGVFVDEIENTQLFSANTNDLTYYDESKMRITLYPGTETQTPPEVFGTSAPAYRGLCYLLFENVNMSYINGNIPEIRVEIATNDTVNRIPFQEAMLTTNNFVGSTPDAMVVDVVNDALYISAPKAPGKLHDGVRKLRLSSLEELDDIVDVGNDIEGSSFNLLTDGNALFQVGEGGQRETVIYNPSYGVELQRFGVDNGTVPNTSHFADTWGKLSVASRSIFGYANGESFRFEDRIVSGPFYVAITDNGGVRIDRFDIASNRMILSNTYMTSSSDAADDCISNCASECETLWCGYNPATESYVCGPEYFTCVTDCEDDCGLTVSAEVSPFASVDVNKFYETTVGDYVRTYNRRFIDVFFLPTGSTQSEVSISRFTISDTGSSTLGNIIPVSGFTTSFSIPASVWGGDTVSIVGQFVIHDEPRGAAIIFLRGAKGLGYVVSVSTDDYATINWTKTLQNFPTNISPGDRTATYPARELLLINTVGDIVALNLTSGDTAVLGNTVEEGFGPFGGRQFYDPTRESITWVDGDKVRRLFPRRTSPEFLSVGTILSRVAARVGIPADQLDVSDVLDIGVTGLGIFGNTQPRNVVQSLIDMFGLSTWEQDGKLHFSREDRGDAHLVSDTDFVRVSGDETYSRTSVDEYDEARSLSFAYADIDNFVRPAYNILSQQISNREDLGPIINVKYETPIAMTPETARNVSEQMYARMHTQQDKVEFSINAERLKYAPNDRVTISFSDGAFLTYKIYEMLYDALLGVAHVTALRDVSYLVSDTVSLEPFIDPRRYKVQTAFNKLESYKVRAFFTTPYRPEDMLASKTHHVIYAGVETAVPRGAVPEIPIKHRVLNEYESVHIKGPTVADPLELGILVTPPDDGVTCWATDNVSRMVIKFHRTETVSLLQNRPKIELLNDRTASALLVGKEWIQYANFEVDADGKTVTFDTLLRGRGGTEVYIDQHSVGEECVLPTVRSFRPIYVLNSRMPKNESISITLTSPIDVTKQSRPYVFNTDQQSVRPWAPGDLSRHQSSSDPEDIYFTWAYRGKWDGALEEIPTFAPDADTFHRFKITPQVSYAPRYVMYGFVNDPQTFEEIEERFVDFVEFDLASFAAFKKESDSPIILLTKSEYQLYYDPDVDRLDVYLVQVGGPRNKSAGFVAHRTFLPGETYDTLPPQPSLYVQKNTGYAVISPDAVRLLNAEFLMVLKP